MLDNPIWTILQIGYWQLLSDSANKYLKNFDHNVEIPQNKKVRFPELQETSFQR